MDFVERVVALEHEHKLMKDLLFEIQDLSSTIISAKIETVLQQIKVKEYDWDGSFKRDFNKD